MNKFDLSNMIHIKKNGIEYLKFKILEQYDDKINHIITLRHGGVSKGALSSLNFRSVGNDSKENNLENLKIVCDTIDFSCNNVYKACQAHTTNILILNDKNKEKYRFDKFCDEKFDGYITSIPNIASLVTTADCNPIIIYDSKNNVVANVHSGWRGTINKIYLKAIEKMKENYGSRMEDIIVCIGPSLKKCCFTSEEEEFKQKFLEVWENEKEYISYESNGKVFHIDLPYVIKKDLLELNVKEENIQICDICTMCNSDDFYSYRKSLNQKLDDYGTFATITYLK